jgi:hypothetical protein
MRNGRSASPSFVHGVFFSSALRIGVLRSRRPAAQPALGLAEFGSLRSSVGDRDLLVPRSGDRVLARASRERTLFSRRGVWAAAVSRGESEKKSEKREFWRRKSSAAVARLLLRKSSAAVARQSIRTSSAAAARLLPRASSAAAARLVSLLLSSAAIAATAITSALARELDRPYPTLARSDHDRQMREGDARTRRGRAPVAHQVA